jgi:hypothetical protein
MYRPLANLHTNAGQLMRVHDAHAKRLGASGYRDKSRLLIGLSHPLGDGDLAHDNIVGFVSEVLSLPGSAEYLRAWTLDAPIENRPKRLAWGHKKAGLRKEWGTYLQLIFPGRVPWRFGIPARGCGSVECWSEELTSFLSRNFRLEICRMSELTSIYVTMDWLASVEAGTAHRVRVFSDPGLLHEFVATTEQPDHAKTLTPPGSPRRA